MGGGRRRIVTAAVGNRLRIGPAIHIANPHRPILFLPLLESQADQDAKRLSLGWQRDLPSAENINAINDIIGGSDREDPPFRFNDHRRPAHALYC